MFYKPSRFVFHANNVFPDSESSNSDDSQLSLDEDSESEDKPDKSERAKGRK